MSSAVKVPSQFPWASRRASIAFIGEAPSDVELLDGFPIVGPSGRVFSQLLRTAGLARVDEYPADFFPNVWKKGLRPMLWERSGFFISNVFDQQLPENNVKNWCQFNTPDVVQENSLPGRIEGAGWLQSEHWQHLLRLQLELQQSKPTLIVPMGGTALWAFTGSTAISASRGAVAKASYLLPGTKLLPILHPAAIIRDWKMFTPTVADLVKAAREAQFPEIRTTAREIWIEPTLEDISYFKEKYLNDATRISVDIETAVGQITCIGFAPNKNLALVIPFVDYRKPDRSYWPSVQRELLAWELAADILQLPAEKLLQNGPYDIYWLWRYAGIKVRNYQHDTRLMHHALFPELPKSLAFMGANYANEGAWKLMREKRSDKRDE